MTFSKSGDRSAKHDQEFNKKLYVKPSLIQYGDVRSVTLGGSFEPIETDGLRTVGVTGAGDETFSRRESDSSDRGSR